MRCCCRLRPHVVYTKGSCLCSAGTRETADEAPVPAVPHETPETPLVACTAVEAAFSFSHWKADVVRYCYGALKLTDNPHKVRLKQRPLLLPIAVFLPETRQRAVAPLRREGFAAALLVYGSFGVEEVEGFGSSAAVAAGSFAFCRLQLIKYMAGAASKRFGLASLQYVDCTGNT